MSSGRQSGSPTRPRAVARVLLLACLALPSASLGSPAGVGPEAEADAAWLAGDHDRALALYERVLESSPDQTRALIRAGLVHFRAGRYDRAEPRLRRALEIRDDPDARLALGRLLAWSGRYREAHQVLEPLATPPGAAREVVMADALALAWGRRFDDAAAGFRRLLERDAADREARLALGRALAWGGRYREAEAQATRLLDADGADADARSLRANLLGWWGRTDAAEREFRRLAGYPDRAGEALAGEAKVARWSGRGLWASGLVAEALDTMPGDARVIAGAGYQALSRGDLPLARRRGGAAREMNPEVGGELLREVERARGPLVRTGWERWSDEDDNRIDLGRAGASWRPARVVELRLDLEQAEAESPRPGLGGFGDAEATTARAGVRLWPGGTARLDVHGGRQRFRGFDGSSRSHTVGGAGLSFLALPRLELSAGWVREGLLWTATLIDNDLTWDRWQLGGRWAPARRWELAAETGRATIEGSEPANDNERSSVRASVTWHLRGERPRLALALVESRLDYDRDLDDGYFDPEDFRAHLLEIRLSGRPSGGRVDLALRLMGGVQEFTRGGRGSDLSPRDFDDTVAGALGTLGVRTGRRGRLVVTAGYTDYAARTATGFAIRSFGLSWHWSR